MKSVLVEYAPFYSECHEYCVSCNGSDNSARDCQRCKFATNESAAMDNYCLSHCEHGFKGEGCTGVPVMSSTLSPYTSDGGCMCVCASAQEHFAVVVSVRAEVVSNKVCRLKFSRVG